MTDEELKEFAKILMRELSITKEKIENALIDYGAGADGWDNLFEHEKFRIVLKVLAGIKRS